ncbi:MAG TPA: hypothetical protein VE736_13040 [Gaiellaceae bacterium]|jgi:hypothetical protein|nr:hypothetical protein [Gaiellaceae bacterium]
MRRAVALALVLVAAGCGGKTAKHPVTAGIATSAPRPSPIRVTISAPTHHPRANAPWPVTVRVTNAAGRPVSATLTMRILFNGTPVGKVDNGRVYHFVGTWREKKGEEITWPPASRNQPLAFEAIVHAQGKTVKQTWAITVR